MSAKASTRYETKIEIVLEKGDSPPDLPPLLTDLDLWDDPPPPAS